MTKDFADSRCKGLLVEKISKILSSIFWNQNLRSNFQKGNLKSLQFSFKVTLAFLTVDIAGNLLTEETTETAMQKLQNFC